MAYDAVIIGGGLAGSALGKCLAEAGKKIIILERETEFRDRVRGEVMHPWGVAEARELGIKQLLLDTCAVEAPYQYAKIAGTPAAEPRDVVATSPSGEPALHFHHPEMQEVLLQAAADHGAEVRRGLRVTGLRQGKRPAVEYSDPDGELHLVEAELVVAADGRSSAARHWANFEVRHMAERMVIAGVLLGGSKVPDHTISIFMNPEAGEFAIAVPLRDGLLRTYHGYWIGSTGGTSRMSGEKQFPAFIEASVRAGMPQEWFEGTEVIGPLASFNAAESWVDMPFSDGIMLIGDAAVSTDPTWGCGTALSLRGVRILRDHLLSCDDWQKAARDSAKEFAAEAMALLQTTSWSTDLWFEPGETASRRREIALPLIAEDPTRGPDIVGMGPEAPSDETARQRFFGEI